MQFVCYLDESGQLAHKTKKRAVIGGFYYLVDDDKNITNHQILKISRKIQKNLKTRKFGFNPQNFPKEIKGKDLTLEDRKYFFETFLKLSAKPFAILLSKHKLEKKEPFTSDENLGFNYLVRLLIEAIIDDLSKKGVEKITKVYIFYDQRSVKPKSANSLEDYLNLFFKFDKEEDFTVSCKAKESHSCAQIQSADIIVNTIFARFHEYLKKNYTEEFKEMIDSECKIIKYPPFWMLKKKTKKWKKQKKSDGTLDFIQETV